MFRRKDPYANQYAQPRSKRRIIIAGAIFGILILIGIFAFGSSTNKKAVEKESVMQRFSNGSFAISYPEGYIQGESPNTSFGVTFSNGDGAQGEGAIKDSIAVSRFGKNGISIESIKKIAAPSKEVTSEEQTISGRKALVTKETQKVDDTHSTINTTFYIYADLFVWKIEFINTADSKQQDYITPVINSFYPRDSELLKL